MNSLKTAGFGGIGFDLASNLKHEVVDGARGAVVIVVPDVFDECIAGIRAVGVLRKKDKQFASLWREPDLRAAAQNRFILRKYLKITKDDGLCFLSLALSDAAPLGLVARSVRPGFLW